MLTVPQIELVWVLKKINITSKGDPTGHGTRREKERQTEKEIGGSYIRMDRIRVG